MVLIDIHCYGVEIYFKYYFVLPHSDKLFIPPNMAPLNRIIIDTDPGKHVASTNMSLLIFLGVDDILAMLLAFAAKPEELEVLLLSVTYGNVEVQRLVNCNVDNLSLK